MKKAFLALFALFLPFTFSGCKFMKVLRASVTLDKDIYTVEEFYAKHEKDTNYHIRSDLDLTTYKGARKVPVFHDYIYGHGHTIKAGKITSPSSDGYCGLLAFKGAILAVEELTVEIDIEFDDEVESVGGLFDTLNCISSFRQVTMKGSINCPNAKYIGGILGYKNCAEEDDTTSFSGCVSEMTINGGEVTGGLLGYTNTECSVRSCTNNGNVTGKGVVGGFVGSVEYKNYDEYDDYITFQGSNSINNGTIKGSNCVGGIIGSTYMPSLDNMLLACDFQECKNNGTIIATDDYAAGICGDANNVSMLY